MNTQIKVTGEYYQIKIPIEYGFSNKPVKRFLDYLRIKQIASESKATEDQIAEFADEVSASFWNANKSKLLNETRN